MSVTHRIGEKVSTYSSTLMLSSNQIPGKPRRFAFCLLSLLFLVPTAQAIDDSGIIGSPGGNGFRVDCGEGAVLAGISSATSSNRMDSIAAHCVDVDAQGRWQGDPEQQTEYGKRFRRSEFGTALCPRDHAVVSLSGTRGSGRFFNLAGSVQPTCQALISSLETGGQIVELDQLGADGEDRGTVECNENLAARGLFGAAGSHVDFYGMICLESSDLPTPEPEPDPEPDPDPVDPPPVAEALSPIPAIGDDGGNGFQMDCGKGTVLAGVATNISPDRMDAIAPVCVEVDLVSGQWTSTPAEPAELFGGSFRSSAYIVTTCAQDHAVVGYTGGPGVGNFEGVVGSVQLHCQLLTSGWSTSGPVETLAAFGASADGAVTHFCQPGFPARALYGAAGSHVDKYGLSCLAPATPVNNSDIGQWSPVIDWPVIAIHSVLSPTGEVLTYGTNDDGVQGAHFYYDIWNPVTNEHTLLDNTLAVDSFCSAPLIIPETKQIIMPGGDARFGEGFNQGIVDAPILDIETRELRPAATMSFARWYPTATMLASGELFIAGGIDGAGNVSVTPEIYSPDNDEWRSLFGAADEQIFSKTEGRWWYPRHWAAPNGQIFGLAGSLSYYIDTDGDGATQLVDNPGMSARDYTSTAVMYRPGLILQVGGRAANGAVVIDINGDTPTFREVAPPVAGGRESWANTTVLPDGSVLLTGGGAGENELDGATLTPELWDPDTETWVALPDFELARLYHSTALLLPDGRVLMGGGGAPGPLTNTNMEIYSPGYLFDEAGDPVPRPVISLEVADVKAGDEITVSFASEKPVTRATLIKSGSVTHSFNLEQRFVELDIAVNGTVLTATLPADVNVLPPGYYLLYLLNEDGVPSVAKLVNVGVGLNMPGPEPEPEPEPDPDPVPDVVLTNTDIVGTPGGTAFSIDCGAGSVLAGVTAVTSSNRMDALASWCVAVDAAGNWQGDPAQSGGEYGKRFGSSQEGIALCPRDHAVVGVTGSRGSESYFVNYAGSIELHCRALTSPVTVDGSEVRLQQLGFVGEGLTSQGCTDGFAARGLFGAAGSHVDHYGLRCLAPE